jgi:hypothetical protein
MWTRFEKLKASLKSCERMAFPNRSMELNLHLEVGHELRTRPLGEQSPSLRRSSRELTKLYVFRIKLATFKAASASIAGMA